MTTPVNMNGHRVTNTDIAAKVEHLSSEVALLKSEQSHLRELITLRFSGFETRVDLWMTRIDNWVSQHESIGDDPGNSPAGKYLLTLIQANKIEIDELKEQSKNSAAWWKGPSAIAWLAVGITAIMATSQIFGWW